MYNSPSPSPAGTSRLAGTHPTGTVTFLFTDIEGSTRHWEAHPQAMQRAFARQEAILRRAIAANGGYAYKMVGDAFQAAFPTAPQALQAALDAQRALHAEQWPPETGEVKVRIALHTGITEERGDDYLGPVLNRVARLLSTAHGGQILLSSATQELVRDALPPDTTLLDMGEHRLKDLTRPEHIYQLVVSGLPAEFATLKTLNNQPNNLPRQTTPLVGREREVAAVCALIRKPEVALVTLTGPGGIGKTSLGLQVGADTLDSFPDGVWFVELAALTDAGLVVSTIAQTLGVREPEVGSRSLLDSLKYFLHETQLLLLLDNFEQVVAASPQVANLIASCPHLKVLVTSRVPLRIKGEREHPVPPLQLPPETPGNMPGQLPPLDILTQCEAVRLFVERARDIKPDFQVTEDNAWAVAEICRRLDGLPLAIELAAARIRLLPPQALRARLEHRLKLLVGGSRDVAARQQTLRGAIDWSYELLGAGEQQLFRRMAVFQGGRALAALEAVCNVDGMLGIDVLDGLERLVESSLLQQREGRDGEPRFWMLETIHEYAREKLAESGDAAALRREHALYFMRLAEKAGSVFWSKETEESLNRLDEEHDNIRAALYWAMRVGGANGVREKKTEKGVKREPAPAVEDEDTTAEAGGAAEAVEIGLRIAGAVGNFWFVRGYFSEGLEYLRALLELDNLEKTRQEGQTQSEVRRVGAGQAANTSRGQGGRVTPSRWRRPVLWAGAGEPGEQATQGADSDTDQMEELEYTHKAARSLALMEAGILAGRQGRYSLERSLYEECLSLERELGDKVGIAYALSLLAIIHFRQEDYSLAGSLLEESLARMREQGNKVGIAWSLYNLGEVAKGRGDYAAARALQEQNLALREELEDKVFMAFGLYRLGEVAEAEGDYAAARSLYERSLALRKELGEKSGIAQSLAGLGALSVAGAVARAGAKAEAGMGDGEEGVKAEVKRGAKLLGAAEALLESIRSVLDGLDKLQYEQAVVSARNLLGAAEYEHVRQEGRAMPAEQAIEYALDQRLNE
ncbi:MAG TPA: tetratricopeptide repeat protein [Chloroflexia bacterium]|nr:tetratricopeptide repeat protein [Chloroflexia bacterium]